MPESILAILNVALFIALVFRPYFLSYYPLFFWESLCLSVIVFAVLIVLHAMLKKFRTGWFFFMVLGLLVVNISAVGRGRMSRWTHLLSDKLHFDQLLVIYLVIIAVVLLLGITGYLLRKKLPVIVLIFLTTTLLIDMIIYPKTPQTSFQSVSHPHLEISLSTKPNIFIIILDEHIGIAGLRTFGEAGDKLADELTESYERYEFTVYPYAYSNYGSTLDSVPFILNGGKYLGTGTKALRRENMLFRKFGDEGYHLRIYQNTYIDYAKTPDLEPDFTFTYDVTSMQYIQPYSFPTISKIYLLFRNFSLRKGLFFEWIYSRTPDGQKEPDVTGAMATDIVLNRVLEDALINKSGTVFFIHLLIPHHSYIFDENGKVRNPMEWENDNDRNQPKGIQNTPQRRNKKIPLYIAQIVYLHKRLNRFFDSLKEEGLYDPSKIVLFGDHGSRISEHKIAGYNLEKLTIQDYIDHFSAFLAVKPISNTSLEDRDASLPLPIYQALTDFFDFHSLNSEQTTKIFVHNKKDFISVDMPFQKVSRTDT